MTMSDKQIDKLATEAVEEAQQEIMTEKRMKKTKFAFIMGLKAAKGGGKKGSKKKGSKKFSKPSVKSGKISTKKFKKDGTEGSKLKIGVGKKKFSKPENLDWIDKDNAAKLKKSRKPRGTW